MLKDNQQNNRWIGGWIGKVRCVGEIADKCTIIYKLKHTYIFDTVQLLKYNLYFVDINTF